MTAPPPLIRKLHALTNRIDEMLAMRDFDSHVHYHFDDIDILPLFQRWTKIRAELLATEPELSDIPDCIAPVPFDFSELQRNRIHRSDIERTRRQIADVWDVINHPSRQMSQISIDREGIFVAGQPFDAMVAITSIFREATRSIMVVDGYVSEHTLSLLSLKADPTTARILTLAKSANSAFVTHAKAFVAQYAVGPPLEIRTTAAFHDRFIVVDGDDYYHFGASLKDAAKRSAFMFSRIEEPSIIATLRATIAKEWAAATVVPL